MTESGHGNQEWSVGELADAAGITVRTLHHYEQVGLLTPASRTGAGHRRYRAAQAEKLYQITAMRSLGFHLEEIRRALDGEDLRSVVRLHRQQVRDRLRETSELNHRLERLLSALETSDHPTEEIIHATEATVTVNLTTIYTRTGDGGETSTAGRLRLPKDDPRIEAGGDVDELNAQLGVVLTHLDTDPFAGWIAEIQNELFDLGADLSGPADSDGLRIDDGYVTRLERRCDEANAQLTALTSFVLPGGGSAAAELHVARTVCRRAERRAVAVDDLNPAIVRYLNRLSDLLFIVARTVSVHERTWTPGATTS
ncbi:cob(I)yrinic acid a,c-diamide adenosyltransferase [Mycobacterium sp.]|uniref:cob(I)yrinic acid a,c-diamide adenosyltransferase n=1 Tax=Mycobacterium sp. TaxID=1785 RepID=UPI003414D057